jgi:hypothetical protein
MKRTGVAVPVRGGGGIENAGREGRRNEETGQGKLASVAIVLSLPT